MAIRRPRWLLPVRPAVQPQVVNPVELRCLDDAEEGGSIKCENVLGRTDDAVRNRYLRLQKKKSTGAASDKPAVTSADLVECQATKKGDMWTAEEDATILAEVRRSGSNKWQDIARILPGRSANAVRNRFLRFPAETRRAAHRIHTRRAAPHR